ncbi:uncharacterized protein LY89DRAFT_711013 [Mollisia scopiformis]|uniref:T6SS Phospholipase effector Tle1-like catalytic domain-containing protein n=1 Tax=Mollisia scopiformis TaxID=149040 RepID=A0A132BCX0_MOLSC|nr:uncharacterized protein LY89DRAFT_711013 [Mollisia scopiformis]KUJ09694.1 hypothetical protein LY89DRAFT_711013 [Mollisia scopiformis]
MEIQRLSHHGPLPTTIRAVRDSHSPARGRTLVVCLDGTGDSFDDDNSNVVNFVACLKKDDPNQVTYYQAGIGTYGRKGLQSGFSAAIDMAVGSGLGIHIRDAYRFLMQNYQEGDRICLLGFSRGSYTVRCLAGMLHKVGLLPAHNRAQVTFAYKFYKDDTPNGWKMSAEFKKTFCMNVNVYFVGVWDCVASVGFIPRKLPFSKSPTNVIGFFRHAMALDEHRAKFKVCRYQPQQLDGVNPIDEKTIDRTFHTQFKGFYHRLFHSDNPDQKTKSPLDKLKKVKTNQEVLEKVFDKYERRTITPCKTDALEVWFMGAHADVGGGAVANEERHMLSRIPLRWMIRQTFECNTGILFDTAGLAETGLDVPTLWPVYKQNRKPAVGPSPKTLELWEKGGLPSLKRRSTVLGLQDSHEEKQQQSSKRRESDLNTLTNSQDTTNPMHLLPEQVEDYFDALAPMNDQLVLAKPWWILEFWPIKVRIQRDEEDGGYWEKVVRWNLGRYRCVQETDPRMHWTVEMRMGEGDKERAYKLRARVDRDASWRSVA